MKYRTFSLLVTIALTSATAYAEAEDNKYQSTPEDVAKVKQLAAKLIGELSSKCPVKPVADHGAFIACREALFSSESALRTSLKRFILWGRPLGGDINAALKDFRATQFGNDVFTGTYAPMWM